MKLTIERKRDNKRAEVTSEDWNTMSARGDARAWRVVKSIAPPPTEIVEAVEAIKRGRKPLAVEPDEVPPEEDE